MRLIFDKHNLPGIFVVKIWLKGGSRNDPTYKKGAHQLLASLLTRGCGPYNNIQMADIIEGCGAVLRSETNEDSLIITLKCATNDIKTLLPIIGWMILAPSLDMEQLNLERDLTLQSLKRQKENPFYLSYDGWRDIIYKDGPYGHDPLGKRKDIQAIKRRDLVSLSEELISNEKIMVVAAIAG